MGLHVTSTPHPETTGRIPARTADRPQDDTPPDPEARPPRLRKEDHADRLVQLARVGELFHSPEGVAFATVQGERRRETWPLRADGFRHWLARQFYLAENQVPAAQALREARDVLEGLARHEGPEHPVFFRKGEQEGTIYLDLADAPGRAVAVDTGGWRVVTDPPVRFRRTRGMLPLPVPEQGGAIDDLRPFLNAASEEDFRLTVAWLLAAMGPHRPYPVLAIHGEQGSAKSTRARVLRRLLDPNQAELRSEPRHSRDLAIAAQHSLALVLDNLRRLPPWLSDNLCCLATGGAFTTRQLFSNDEEVIFAAMRPVIVTSVVEVATAPDLLDRALSVSPAAIPEAERQPEATFWAAFDRARPRLLGALLDAVALGLRRLPSTRPERLPRMADFATWGSAIEPALGWEPGGFMAAYRANRGEANDLALESSPIAALILELVAERGEWRGLPNELLQVLKERGGEAARSQHGWSRSPEALSHALRTIMPNLRAAGVALEKLPRTRMGQPMRLVAVRPPAAAGGVGSSAAEVQVPPPQAGALEQPTPAPVPGSAGVQVGVGFSHCSTDPLPGEDQDEPSRLVLLPGSDPEFAGSDALAAD